jgi:BirA family biotin operon repressor/biotin-[acetyl-CoA-carboxylase] ligase
VNIRTNNALFPILRRLSDGAFHSGEDLALEFGFSRASVFNVLNQAEAMGLAIHAVRGRGYRLPVPIDWIDSEAIACHLGELSTAFALHVEDVLDSTNTSLMNAAMKGAIDGTVVCAEHQRSGRGRRGRRWHSVPGGSLTFSVLWRFENGLQALGGLSLAVGLAIARAVNRQGRFTARLKWPNDVLVDFRKLAGILVEVQGDPHGSAIAVVGIGLNVRLDPAQRDAVDQAMVDLHEMGATIGRNELLADCLRELHAVMGTFRRQGFGALRDAWQELDAYAGRRVYLGAAGSHRAAGVAAGVDETGALLLRDPQAGIRAYTACEVSLRLDGAR